MAGPEKHETSHFPASVVLSCSCSPAANCCKPLNHLWTANPNPNFYFSIIDWCKPQNHSQTTNWGSDHQSKSGLDCQPEISNCWRQPWSWSPNPDFYISVLQTSNWEAQQQSKVIKLVSIQRNQHSKTAVSFWTTRKSPTKDNLDYLSKATLLFEHFLLQFKTCKPPLNFIIHDSQLYFGIHDWRLPANSQKTSKGEAYQQSKHVFCILVFIFLVSL